MIYKRTVYFDPLEETEISAYPQNHGMLCIEISEKDMEMPKFILLNKETAQEFVQYLKEQVKLLDDE